MLLPNSARELIFQLGVVRFAFVNAVSFSRVLCPHSPPVQFLQISTAYHFLKEAFLDRSYPSHLRLLVIFLLWHLVFYFVTLIMNILRQLFAGLFV